MPPGGSIRFSTSAIGSRLDSKAGRVQHHTGTYHLPRPRQMVDDCPRLFDSSTRTISSPDALKYPYRSKQSLTEGVSIHRRLTIDISGLGSMQNNDPTILANTQPTTLPIARVISSHCTQRSVTLSSLKSTVRLRAEPPTSLIALFAL